jgi:DNA-binding CsgD family transcriptional regulator
MPNGLVLEFEQNPCVQFVLTDQVGTLGRSPKCHFMVNDPTVSRLHARLQRTDVGFAVVDLDSRNGTFIDEERVKTGKVCSGQRIRFGSLTFKARVEDMLDPEERTANCDSAFGDEPGPACHSTSVLSNGQRRVFDRLLTGQSEKAIARHLELSPNTVHNHIQAIFRLLEVHSKAELVARYLVSEARKTRFK